MSKIACIGKREITPEDEKLLMKIGGYLATQGHVISSGNAEGSDRFFALGANMVDPARVELHLPVKDHNPKQIWLLNKLVVDGEVPEYRETASKLHPAWDKLPDFVKKLHTRNVGIVKDASLVIALPNWEKPGGGGTGMGLKVAQELNIPVLDLTKSEDRARVLAKIEGK